MVLPWLQRQAWATFGSPFASVSCFWVWHPLKPHIRQGKAQSNRSMPRLPVAFGMCSSIWLTSLRGMKLRATQTYSLSKELAVLHPVVPCVLACLHSLVVIFCMCNKFLYPNIWFCLLQVLFQGGSLAWFGPALKCFGVLAPYHVFAKLYLSTNWEYWLLGPFLWSSSHGT